MFRYISIIAFIPTIACTNASPIDPTTDTQEKLPSLQENNDAGEGSETSQQVIQQGNDAGMGNEASPEAATMQSNNDAGDAGSEASSPEASTANVPYDGGAGGDGVCQYSQPGNFYGSPTYSQEAPAGDACRTAGSVYTAGYGSEGAPAANCVPIYVGACTYACYVCPEDLCIITNSSKDANNQWHWLCPTLLMPPGSAGFCTATGTITNNTYDCTGGY